MNLDGKHSTACDWLVEAMVEILSRLLEALMALLL